MTSIDLSLIAFGCTFGGALLGMLLRRFLSEKHVSAESKDLVTRSMALISTMTGLVLGLLLNSARSTHDAQKGELTDMSAKIMLLDHVLAHYGPETGDTRAILRRYVARGLDQIWPQEASSLSRSQPAAGGVDILYEKVLQLSPKDDAQRSLRAQLLGLAMEIGRARWLMVEDKGRSIAMPLLFSLVFWLALLFISFGIFAPPPNALAISAVLVCALAVSGAILLILEMDRPFQGLMQIPSAPLRNALSHLGE
jgi:hypothetical protein